MSKHSADVLAFRSAVEEEAEAVIPIWIDLVTEKLTSEAGHLELRRGLRDLVRSGTLPTMQVIAAARDGNEDADIALRELGVEMLDRGELPPAALRVYLQEALLQAPVPSPPGRNIADTWRRDIGIAALVALALRHWPHLKATRNRASKWKSASDLVAGALTRRGHPMTPAHVGRIYQERDRLAQKLSASIPPI